MAIKLTPFKVQWSATSIAISLTPFKVQWSATYMAINLTPLNGLREVINKRRSLSLVELV